MADKASPRHAWKSYEIAIKTNSAPFEQNRKRNMFIIIIRMPLRQCSSFIDYITIRIRLRNKANGTSTSSSLKFRTFKTFFFVFDTSHRTIWFLFAFTLVENVPFNCANVCRCHRRQWYRGVDHNCFFRWMWMELSQDSIFKCQPHEIYGMDDIQWVWTGIDITIYQWNEIVEYLRRVRFTE